MNYFSENISKQADTCQYGVFLKIPYAWNLVTREAAGQIWRIKILWIKVRRPLCSNAYVEESHSLTLIFVQGMKKRGKYLSY